MRAGFERLVAQHKDRVYNQAYRMLGNHEDAEEAAQDAFLKVHRALAQFRGDSQEATWIYRIAANVCIDALRRKQLDTISMDAPQQGEAELTLAATLADPAPGPDDRAAAAETAATVRQMVSLLPPPWAMAVTLYHFDGRTYEEIAAVMDLPVATVGTYIHRGRQRLARELAGRLDPASADAGPLAGCTSRQPS